MTAHPPLWTCPRCGHQFIGANMSHSCSRHELAEHFADRPPELRAAFDRALEIVERAGPVTVIAQKTRIVLMVRVRFVNVVVRSRWMDYSIALRHEVSHPLLLRVDYYPPRWWAHIFRFRQPADVDDEIAGWLAESYRVGAQES